MDEKERAEKENSLAHPSETEVVVNYTVVRYRPYPQTEEFVNVGLLYFCRETGKLDLFLDKKLTGRVGVFFPRITETEYEAEMSMVASFYSHLTGLSPSSIEVLLKHISHLCGDGSIHQFSNCKTLLVEKDQLKSTMENRFKMYTMKT